ncbi:MAG: low specificity L-threonine aldolase [Firmicutes bacterium]|nr:low specificity L-threonine aldolase [Bacillota bacterium]
MKDKLPFASDYMKGAHPNILKRMNDTNMLATAGYGEDLICDAAKDKIRDACGCPDAQIEFLMGGTQANAVMIKAFLRPYEGVVAVNTGHINIHEGGAIEATGHKVLARPHKEGKLDAGDLRTFITDFYNDSNHEHSVFPGMVYISHPTEFGTLYSKEELTELRSVCDDFDIPLYLDGARLAYALACPENDLTLKDIAKLCDAFYIGGTKCGALLGEAVVLPNPNRIPHLYTMIKQHGGSLAKGRLLGIQFDELFSNDLYMSIGETAIRTSHRIRRALVEFGYKYYFETPSNQIFIVLDNEKLAKLGEKVRYEFWEKFDDSSTIIRLCTSWSTTDEEVDDLIKVIKEIAS